MTLTNIKQVIACEPARPFCQNSVTASHNVDVFTKLFFYSFMLFFPFFEGDRALMECYNVDSLSSSR